MNELALYQLRPVDFNVVPGAQRNWTLGSAVRASSGLGGWLDHLLCHQTWKATACMIHFAELSAFCAVAA
jgi:hypothetical protein